MFVLAVLFGFRPITGLLKSLFSLSFGVLGFGLRIAGIAIIVLFALAVAAIVMAILRRIRSDRQKDEPDGAPSSGGTTVKASKSANGQKTAYVHTNPNTQKTVNPYSSHATSRPQPEPEPEPEPVKKPEPVSTGNRELDLVLKQGRGYIARMEELNGEIPDFKVSARIKQIEILTEKIFGYIEAHPEDIHQTRQMLSYYLPTTVKLLERYIELQNQGIRMGNIDEGMQKVEALLDKLAVAFQQQLDGLFEDDLVDITADIQVMEQMLASEGLTGTKDF